MYVLNGTWDVVIGMLIYIIGKHPFRLLTYHYVLDSKKKGLLFLSIMIWYCKIKDRARAMIFVLTN